MHVPEVAKGYPYHEGWVPVSIGTTDDEGEPQSLRGLSQGREAPRPAYADMAYRKGLYSARTCGTLSHVQTCLATLGKQ